MFKLDKPTTMYVLPSKGLVSHWDASDGLKTDIHGRKYLFNLAGRFQLFRRFRSWLGFHGGNLICPLGDMDNVPVAAAGCAYDTIHDDETKDKIIETMSDGRNI